MKEPKIQLLDCTLRDGSYIVNAEFGERVLKGITRKLSSAGVDIIECGWLKDAPYKPGTAFFHIPSDAAFCTMKAIHPETTFAAMIDWDRYRLDNLPENDGKSMDAIRMVFPKGKGKIAIPMGRQIQDKGYRLFFQAANTLGYSDDELKELASQINAVKPEVLSVVDTFGAMYPEDLDRIFHTLDRELDPEIRLGFHSHNNQQLSFALSMEFLKLGENGSRHLIVDSSLCGMGRGAGNTTTELLANYINRKYAGNYDMNGIMDTIDMYLAHIQENYQWGYSIPYCIAGMYCSHVNNIAYLLKNHKTLSRDMRIMIESIDPETRKKYDYDNLEKIYVNYQNRVVDDAAVLEQLEQRFRGKTVLLLGPGRTLTTHKKMILEYIAAHRPECVSINTVPDGIPCENCFFVNPQRYLYASENDADLLKEKNVILTSNIKRESASNERIINYNLLVKLGWEFFDNSCIMALRLMAKLKAAEVIFAGFDGFPEDDAGGSFYADRVTQPVVDREKRVRINTDVTEMLRDFLASSGGKTRVQFLTPSRFEIVINDKSERIPVYES